MNTAIIVTGTICSEKSTLSNKISKFFDFDVPDENNPNHFYGNLDKIKTNDFTSPIIIEHTDLAFLLTHLCT